MNAVPIVSSFPCQTNTKNVDTETKIGTLAQMNEKSSELMRSGGANE